MQYLMSNGLVSDRPPIGVLRTIPKSQPQLDGAPEPSAKGGISGAGPVALVIDADEGKLYEDEIYRFPMCQDQDERRQLLYESDVVEV